MKYVLALLAVLILAQCASAQNVTVIGPITAGDCPQFSSNTVIKDSGFNCNGAPAIPLANPTGTIGLTTVNGVATTAMRSDAAPPLSASVQASLTATSGNVLIGTGAFGFSSAIGGPQITAATYGASGSAQNTTATCTATSASVTLAAAIDFKNGQSIALEHCGAAFTASAPTGLAVSTQGATGTTTYAYQIASIDDNGGVGTAITAVQITNGPATLGTVNLATRNVNSNKVSWTPGAGSVGTAIWRSTSGGGFVLLGVFGLQANTFSDNGQPTATIPWIPATPTVSTLADRFVTTISSGAGTTSITLAAAVTTSGSGVYTRHDDTAALNAYTAAQTQIVIPPGTYNVEGFTIPSTVQTMVCAGSAASIIQGWNGSTAVVTASSMPANFRFNACAVEAISPGNTTGMLLQTTSGHPVVTNSRFGGAIAFNSSTNNGLSFVNNTLDVFYTLGISEGHGSNNTLALNHFLQSLDAVFSNGINVAFGASILVVGNVLEGGIGGGIRAQDTSQVKITANAVFGSLRESYHISANTSDWQISNNMAYSNVSIDYCLSVSDDQRAVSVNNGQIVANSLSFCGMAGIGIAGFNQASTVIDSTNITGNWIYNSNQDNQGAPLACDIQLNGTEVQRTFINGNSFSNLSNTNLYNVCEVNSSGTPQLTQVGANYGSAGTTARYNLIGSNSVAIGSEAPGVAYTPTITCGAGSGSATGRFKQIEKWIDFAVSITNCSSAGTVSFSVPASVKVGYVFQGRDNTNGNDLIGIVSSGVSSVSVVTAANANPTAGDTLVVTGRYETQ